VKYQDWIIVTWTSHLVDENGPGQRLLARLGRLSDNGDVDWSDQVVELAAPPVAMKPRGTGTNPDYIDGPYIVGRLNIVGGKLYFKGSVRAYDGWADEARFNGDQTQPIPAEHYGLELDRAKNFKYAMRRDLNMRFIQSWDIGQGQLVPTSPVYLVVPMVESVEVTPGKHKPVVALNRVYREAEPIENAPKAIQEAYHAEPDMVFERSVNYPPGTAHLAADGHNALAHWAEYRRPDGTWVVVRDNLDHRGCYYAATKTRAEDHYPPAVRTNLFGDVDPEAGELPDGSVWLIGNDYPRVHFYITVSKDGIHFDRTWLLYKARVPIRPGLGKTGHPNGPQYPQTLLHGDKLMVFYSIGKQRIGMSVVPIDRLMKPSAQR
jgi:hypothetical protein